MRPGRRRIFKPGLAFLGLHEGHEIGHRLLHDACRFDDLRQKHLAGAEQVADDVHAVHQRAFDHVKRSHGGKARLLRIGVDVIGDAMDERVLEALTNWALAPGEIGRLFLGAASLEPVCGLKQAVGRVGPPVEDDVLAKLAKLRLQVVIDAKLARIHDPHVHACLDGVVEEDRMHGLADRLIAAERKGQVRDAARDMHMRQFRADTAHRLDVGDGVIIMLLDPGRDRENVRIEDDVLGGEACAFGEQTVGALADREFPLRRVCLPLLVERHDDHRRSIAQDLPGLSEKWLLAFLEADRIDDGFALHAFQSCFDHHPFR